MKRKTFVVGLLVVVCLGALVVEVVSQPAPQPIIAPLPIQGSVASFPATPPPSPGFPGEPKPTFNAVQPQQQEWTFEQLVEALKGVRARQKELQTQEADLLAKMAKKIEEKRQDLSKSEATLRQLQENGRVHPEKRFGELKMEEKKR